MIIARLEQVVDFFVDGTADLIGYIRAGLREIAAQEHLVLLAQEHRAELAAHAVLGHHGARGLRGLFKIARGAGGHIAQHEPLGAVATQTSGNGSLQARTGNIAGLLIGQPHGVSTRALAARNDGHLMHLVALGNIVHDDGVSRLVIGHEMLVSLRNLMALLFGAGTHAGDGLLDGGHGNFPAIGARGEYRRLVEHILEICAGKVGRSARNDRQIDVRSQRFALGVNLQYILATLDVRIAHGNLAVKPAGTQQRRIEYVRAVGGRHDDDALIGGKAVHFDQQLVERLFALVMAAAQTRAALTTHRVDLVDEHDGRRALFRLVKQIAHAARAHAHEHFHKVRAGNRKERHPRLARNSASQQRFARAGRADEQHALGHARAQLLELLRILQEIDDLAQLLRLLLRACDIGKCNLVLARIAQPRAGSTEVHHALAATALLAHHEIPQHAEERHGHKQRNPLDPPGRRGRRRHGDGERIIAHLDERSVLAQLFGIDGVDVAVKLRRARQERRNVIALRELAGRNAAVTRRGDQIAAGRHDILQLVILDHIEYFGIVDAAHLIAHRRAEHLHGEQYHDNQRHINQQLRQSIEFLWLQKSIPRFPSSIKLQSNPACIPIIPRAAGGFKPACHSFM